MAADLLGEKWFGEPGEARALADRLLAEAPVDDESAVVAAVAFREEWLYKDTFESDDDGATALVTDPANRQWLLAALDRSLGAPGHRTTAATPLVRNAFAFAFHIAGMHAEAGEQFRLLDGLATESPWGLLGKASKVYARAARRT